MVAGASTLIVQHGRFAYGIIRSDGYIVPLRRHCPRVCFQRLVAGEDLYYNRHFARLLQSGQAGAQFFLGAKRNTPGLIGRTYTIGHSGIIRQHKVRVRLAAYAVINLLKPPGLDPGASNRLPAVAAGQDLSSCRAVYQPFSTVIRAVILQPGKVRKLLVGDDALCPRAFVLIAPLPVKIDSSDLEKLAGKAAFSILRRTILSFHVWLQALRIKSNCSPEPVPI